MKKDEEGSFKLWQIPDIYFIIFHPDRFLLQIQLVEFGCWFGMA